MAAIWHQLEKSDWTNTNIIPLAKLATNYSQMFNIRNQRMIVMSFLRALASSIVIKIAQIFINTYNFVGADFSEFGFSHLKNYLSSS